MAANVSLNTCCYAILLSFSISDNDSIDCRSKLDCFYCTSSLIVSHFIELTTVICICPQCINTTSTIVCVEWLSSDLELWTALSIVWMSMISVNFSGILISLWFLDIDLSLSSFSLYKSFSNWSNSTSSNKCLLHINHFQISVQPYVIVEIKSPSFLFRTDRVIKLIID